MISPILIQVACGLAALILAARAGYSVARRHNVRDDLRYVTLLEKYKEVCDESTILYDTLVLAKKALADGDEDATVEFFEKVETLFEDSENEEA